MHYTPFIKQNRLYSVDDAVVPTTSSSSDMEDMLLFVNGVAVNGSNNYIYSKIGELVGDAQEEIDEIVWRVDSKIKEVKRSASSDKKSLKFEYDPMGNRIAKYVYDGEMLESSTFYVRDAQGTTIAVYDEKMITEVVNSTSITTVKYALAERHIYGSSRLGMDTTEVVVPQNEMVIAPTGETTITRHLKKKLYELSNHLGNVLTVISDMKIPVGDPSTGVLEYYNPHIISVTDYSPFGVALSARTWSEQEYRFGFNGKELDNEIFAEDNSLAFEARIYGCRLGRFLSIDPLAPKYPMLSPYCFAANSPIRFIDVLGLGPGDVVVAFGGGDFMGTGDKGGAPAIIEKVNAQHINQVGGASRSFSSQFWGVSPDNTTELDKATQGAYNYIKANYNMHNGKKIEGGKIIIEGYSLGGVMASHLAKRLEADNIQVDLLITIDAAAAWETEKVDRTISANVKENLNIYQTTPSSVQSHGGANTAIDPTKTTIINSNYTGYFNGTPGQSDYQESSHSTIDEMSQGRIVQSIVSTLGGQVLRTPSPIELPKNNAAPADKTKVNLPIVKPLKIKFR